MTNLGTRADQSFNGVTGKAAQTPIATIQEVVHAHRGRPGEVLAVLERLQHDNPHNYLPNEVVHEAARLMGIPLSQAFGVVSFYAFFNRKPQGRHSLVVCRGTACHTRGSRNLLDAAQSVLSFPNEAQEDRDKLSKTTTDNHFTLRTVACFGQCALAPVVECDRVIHGHMNRQKILGMIEKLSAEGGQS